MLLGANCVEEHPLMKGYTKLLTQEMEKFENKSCTTPKGDQVKFRFKLIPSDMKWISTFSGELNNAATDFSPFANVNQTNKNTIGGSIGGNHATWQPWSYNERLKIAKKVEDFKKSLQDQRGKQRSKVTKFNSKQVKTGVPSPSGKICRHHQTRALA